MVSGKLTFAVAVVLVASLGFADAQQTSAAEPTPPVSTSSPSPSPTESPTEPTPTPTPTPTTTPTPVPPVPPVAGPVYLPLAQVKLKKIAGGTSVVRGTGAVFGTKGKLVKYTVEVQTKLPHAQQRAQQLEAFTRWAFGDTTRGWTAKGARRMQRVDNVKDAKIRVLLALPKEVDKRCRKGGAYTGGKYSCYNGFKVAAINVIRWRDGSVKGKFPSINEYRAYVVNHEVGHGLGYNHRACTKKGALANVMLQQSRVTYGCRANGWPYPTIT